MIRIYLGYSYLKKNWRSNLGTYHTCFLNNDLKIKVVLSLEYGK